MCCSDFRISSYSSVRNILLEKRIIKNVVRYQLFPLSFALCSNARLVNRYQLNFQRYLSEIVKTNNDLRFIIVRAKLVLLCSTNCSSTLLFFFFRSCFEVFLRVTAEPNLICYIGQGMSSREIHSFFSQGHS